MEKLGEQEKLKSQSQTALIRCAKAALLLSSLRNATNDLTTCVPQLQDEEKVKKLKIGLVKEKLKLKKLRLWLEMGMLFYWLCSLILLLFLVLNYL